MRRAIVSWMKEIHSTVLARHPATRSDVDGLPWATLEELGNDLLGSVMMEAWKFGYARFNILRKQDHVREDPIGLKAKHYATTTGAAMIKGITAETRTAIQETIVTAIDRGWGAAKTARILRTNIGLTQGQAAAVSNNLTRLLDAGVEEARAWTLTERYAQKLQTSRAETIARTEINNALREGIVETMSEQGIERVIWVADPECCPICEEYDGEEYTIDEYGDIMNPHPNCECTVVMA
jgi:SPP1 gp7 family putative phage head morphogenesis protein